MVKGVSRSVSEFEHKELILPSWDAFENRLSSHPHEAAEVRFIESIVEPGMNTMDVGANIGVVTMALSRGSGEHGKVYAFEPQPTYFRILEGNLAANGIHNASAFPLAVTDRVGIVDFYDKGFASGIVRAGGAERTEVVSTTIDDFVADRRMRGVDLIAMDCEGSELLVLRGAENTLRSNSVKVVCEIHHDFLSSLGQSVGEIVEYLDHLGFEVQALSAGDMETAETVDNAGYLYAWKVIPSFYAFL
jgi:FkbM family methyltransferase